jgi:hypothetical protein
MVTFGPRCRVPLAPVELKVKVPEGLCGGKGKGFIFFVTFWLPDSFNYSNNVKKEKQRLCAVFTSIPNFLKQYNKFTNVKEFMLDFEKTKWLACKTVFPAAKPIGCSFHLTQSSFYRNAKKIFLLPQYAKDKETRKICREILSFYLISTEKIQKQNILRMDHQDFSFGFAAL